MNPDDMTPRDLFALIAWQALLSTGQLVEPPTSLPQLAYIHADEMMAEFARQQPTASGG